MSVLREDLERAITAAFDAGITDHPVDIAGRKFDIAKPRAWVEPRVVAIRSDSRQRPQDVSGALTLVVTCYLKVEPKGGVELALSGLVDVVRGVVDSNLGAPNVQVVDKDGDAVALLRWQEAQETRNYDASVASRGQTVNGVDLAQLTATARIIGPC